MIPDLPEGFVQFLRNEQARGTDSALEARRATAIAFYDGQPYGDEVEGRSQAVTRDVSEVVDTQQVGILNTILASGKAVEFETEPEQATDENGQPAMQPIEGSEGEDGQPQTRPVMVDYGEEATAAIRHQFFRKQNGYRVLHDALKAGQMELTGIVKTYVEPQPPKREQRQLLADEVLETEQGPMTADGLRIVSADPIDIGLYEAIVEVPQPPLHRDAAVPNEYFRVSPDADTLDDAVYVGERMQRSLSDLAKLGYDVTVLAGVVGQGGGDTTLERARDANRSIDRNSIGNRPGANRTIWLEEEYVLYDLNGDGIAERLFVHRVGNVVLNVMEVDEQPYSLWSPFPRQHRLTGDSTADKVMPFQRIRSVLLRSALDSLYIANAPRTLVDEGSMTVDTIDDLLTVRPGGLIRYKGVAPAPLQQVDTSQTAFNAMEMMAGEREGVTGVTRQSQGLNPDTMNKTATGMGMLMAQSQQIEQYVTRNFVEFIVGPMFGKRYRLMRKHGQPFRMKIEGKYRTIDPRKWPEDINTNINVGLGTGNKDQKVAYRSQLFEIQQAVVQNGGRIVGEKQVYENIRGFVQDTGIGSPSEYVLNPDDLPPAQPQPDPETVKAQADAQVRQAKDQQAHELAMSRLQLQQAEAEASNTLKARQQEFDLTAAREKQALHAELERDRATFEADLAIDRQQFDMDLAEKRLLFDQEIARKKAAADDGALPNLRPGGDLDK